MSGITDSLNIILAQNKQFNAHMDLAQAKLDKALLILEHLNDKTK